MELSERLKSVRKSLGLSQIGLAERLSVSQSAISQIEKGVTYPSGEFLRNISITYNLNVNWLLTGKGSMFVDNDDKDDEQIAALKDEIAKLQAENNKLNKELLQTLKELCRFQRKELQQK